ncbi:FAD-dependent oxidoreductase [Lichenihabitans psoromatis]|uniref:FAD-dependent oxidoreductase n=1 Tax=Lichenihabitans psoromatis TaxID=2528642 RepID=UPI002478654D|nr:FAD-dependent oxidoreductase [Lichenihabitans psoromatis]
MTDHAFDVCVIGAGSAGLSVAAGCAQLGLATALIEQGAMGGECLNTGCVPSKALLAAAKRVHAAAAPKMAGLGDGDPTIDFGGVKDGIQNVIDRIAPYDSAARFEGMGVTVLRGTARFENARTLTLGTGRVRSRWIVLATGSRPTIPSIPGLNADTILTNETIFRLRHKPDHLLILGGGPIGVEMAFAHRRLGVPVTSSSAARSCHATSPNSSGSYARRCTTPTSRFANTPRSSARRMARVRWR